MIRILLICFLSYFFAGCVGVGAIYSKKREVTYNKQYTKDEILSRKGEPSKISFENNDETWTYKKDMRWNGIVIVAIVPIPLALPTGFREEAVYFENNVTVGSTKEYGKSPTAMCSIIPIMWLVHGSTNGWCHIFKSW